MAGDTALRLADPTMVPAAVKTLSSLGANSATRLRPARFATWSTASIKESLLICINASLIRTSLRFHMWVMEAEHETIIGSSLDCNIIRFVGCS
jgi:hypothetical protein